MTHVKILLVRDKVSEDTDTINILYSLGYDVLNPTLNLEEFCTQDNTPELILIDTSICKIDSKLSSKLEDSNIPIIFIIQPYEESEIEQLNLKQPYDQLIRPFTPRELKYAVEFLIYKSKTENELNKFYLPITNSPLPYQALDSEGNILNVNHAWLNVMGYSKEEVIGKNISNFMTFKSSKNFKNDFTEFKAVGEIQGAEFEIKKSGGSHLIVSCDAKVVCDGSNSLGQTHCIFQDITKIKKYEERIKQINNLHSTINRINQSMLRIRNRDELFQTVCDVIVEYGNFEMAWVGLIDFETGKINPITYSGNESGYLKTIPLNIFKSPLAQKNGYISLIRGV